MAKVLTPARRARLEKLAAYLEGLPENYSHFDMSDWVKGRGEDVIRYALHNGGVASCGTAACAAGHGPAAGILVPKACVANPFGDGPFVDWDAYCELFVGDNPRERGWCFGGLWEEVDNHHHGAAARIRYLLDHGAAPGGYHYADEEWLPLYAPYRIDAKAQADA